MKILLVEDDEPTATVLASVLMDDRHMINIATDGQMGLMLAETYDYDLILLDVLIPKLDGITICRKLRSQGLQMPILLLTAQDSQMDKVAGLDAGADDYVVKPFDLAELRARIRALLRRGNTPITSVLTWENLCLDPNANEVTYNHQPVALTPKEYGILELFLRYPQRVFSRSLIIDRLWSMDNSPAESAVTTHIKDLRQKLKASGMKADLIETVYGLGYRLKSPPNPATTPDPTLPDSPPLVPTASPVSSDPDPDATTPAAPAIPIPAPPSFSPSPLPSPSPAPSPQGIAAIQRVLDKFRNSFTDQIAVLRQANIALQEGILSLDLKQQARQEAHKLAGSLGIFGYPNGSKLAREAEYLLLDEAIPLPTMQVQFAQVVAALQQEVSRSPDPIGEPKPASVSKTLLGHLPRSVPVPALPKSSLLVLVIDPDQAFTEQLQIQAGSCHMQVEVASHPDIARRTIAQTLPDVVLLDLSLPDTDVAGMALLAELTQQYPTLPVLIFTGRDSLADRVEISRLGAKAFLHKSMPIAQILQTIEQVLLRPGTTEAKILIVDDDPASLLALSSLLQPWGLEVTTLTDPRRFWDMLVTTEPDLVVFDLEMPTFSGIDLCQVVRHDPKWGNLPILVVTAHTDAASIHSVFAAGADDFVAKPVVGPELVTRVLSRIERVRSRQALSPASF